LNSIWEERAFESSMYNLRPITQRVDLLLLEQRELSQSGPHIRIVHRFRKPNTVCAWGEEVFAASVIDQGRPTPVLVPLGPRLLLNYFAEHRHMGQSAAQIAAGVRASLFYRRHGSNSGVLTMRRISRSSVKEYVKRLRRALAAAFERAGLAIDPMTVLASEKTEGNEVLYRLRAHVEWVHQP
jgi:hypothetical protein